jgi:uncharacterized RDD family membrane protein YckC
VSDPSRGPRPAYATRGDRFVGQMLDALVAFGPLIVASFFQLLSDAVAGGIAIGAVFWAIFYIFFADGLNGGRSYAKKWLDMYVIEAATGRPCTFGMSFIRNFLLWLLGPIDWIFIFGDRHQRLGDKAAGTIVVHGTPPAVWPDASPVA